MFGIFKKFWKFRRFYLIKKKDLIEDDDINGKFPLLYAIEKGNLKTIKILINLNANLFKKFKKKTLLQISKEKNENFYMTDFLEEKFNTIKRKSLKIRSVSCEVCNESFENLKLPENLNVNKRKSFSKDIIFDKEIFLLNKNTNLTKKKSKLDLFNVFKKKL